MKQTFQIGNLHPEAPLGEEVDGWVLQQETLLGEDPSRFPMVFSLANRLKSKLLPGVSLPEGWTPLTLLRAKILLIPSVFEKAMEWIEETFRTADLGESLDLYRLLPLVAQDLHSETLLWRVGEGLRTNAPPVFEAVAHHSPLPSRVLSEEAWNQMVLKALFIECPIEAIEGWRERRNPVLDTMALRFASERAMAHRDIPSDVWKLVMEPISEKGKLSVKDYISKHPREHFVHLLKIHYPQH